MRWTLTTVGAVCGILTTVCFVGGIVFSAVGGVQTIIPETGKNGLDWIADVHDAGGPYYLGNWLVVLGGFFALVAIVGFWEALRDAHPLVILGPILIIPAFTIVQISHLIPLGLAYEFVPAYVKADAAQQATLAVEFHTWTSVALVLNYAGDVLIWGVVVPLYAWAALKTGAVARWIGWLGVFVAVFAGWLGLFAPLSGVIDGLPFFGFAGFFVWIAARGVSLLRRHGRADEPVPAPAL